MSIEELDASTGDFHPHKIGEKVNEMIRSINDLNKRFNSLIDIYKDDYSRLMAMDSQIRALSILYMKDQVIGKDK